MTVHQRRQAARYSCSRGHCPPLVTSHDRSWLLDTARRLHGGLMPRSVVGLLAALGVVLSSLLAFVHGDLTPLVVVGSGTATGLAAYLALPSQKSPVQAPLRQ